MPVSRKHILIQENRYYQAQIFLYLSQKSLFIVPVCKWFSMNDLRISKSAESSLVSSSHGETCNEYYILELINNFFKIYV